MTTKQSRGRNFQYSYHIAKPAPGGPGFRNPVDMVFYENMIFAISRGTEGEPCGRVGKFTKDERFVGQFATYGTGDGQFIWPTALAVDEQGLVYMADEWLNRVSVYDGNGEWEGEILETSDKFKPNYLRHWGKSGSELGELDGPAGMVFDQDHNLYITENQNHRVSKFTKDGEFLFAFGNQGSGEGEFMNPWGINIDSNGDIYVADWGNGRVQKFSPDGSFIMSFGSYGQGQGELDRPGGVAVDKDGDVFITDWWGNKVEVFDPEGKHLITLNGDATGLSKWGQEVADANLAGSGGQGAVAIEDPELSAKIEEGNKSFGRPKAIRIDEDGLIGILEEGKSRIQFYYKNMS